jgi:hypothetical protein
MFTLDTDLQALVDNQTLRHVSSDGGVHEYVIDAFKHRELTGYGWQVFIYRLTVDEAADEGRYEISEELEYQGGDNLLSTDSIDEVVSWIAERQE